MTRHEIPSSGPLFDAIAAGPPVEYVPRAFEEYSFDDMVAACQPDQHTAQMYGKRFNRPRLEAWFHDDPQRLYRFGGGKPMRPRLWPALLDRLRAEVQDRAGEFFDSCFANFYRHGNDSISWHADDSDWIGPVIASVTLGSARRFRMRSKSRTQPRAEYDLGHGDLLIMRAGCQDAWEHCVPKSKRSRGQRLNLTFRQTRTG